MIFQKYAEDPQLDVIECLRTYITLTKNYRVAENQKQALFLSYKAPFKPVATCSIARWLKLVMAEAGANTSVFKAHSTRAASTSEAQMQGLSTAQIIERANWSKGSRKTFIQLKKINIKNQYYQSSYFEQAILYLLTVYEIKLEIYKLQCNEYDILTYSYT